MLKFPLHINTSIVHDSLLTQKNVQLSVLRLDEINEHISGNKLFKLYYYLQNAIAKNKEGILTFGGAFSNHLVATAFACKQQNLKAIGIVRGEKPTTLSHTLLQCEEFNMQLIYVPRQEYIFFNVSAFYNFEIVPEGGFGQEGARGAMQIMNYLNNENYTHICCAVGTATTLAGLSLNNNSNKEIIAVPAIKNMTDIGDRLNQLQSNNKNITIHNKFSFGGYAKYNQQLVDFMNWFYNISKIPTDFVYTAKLMYTIFQLIEDNYFKPESRIICLHTGGLQGNKSLAKNTLVF
jgi:1-aminocyclopropane-1-carboxylate deaminase